jgi:hypothetical protein
MRRLVFVICLVLVTNLRTAYSDTYIDKPGTTIVQSTPISPAVPVNVDYYTQTSPGTRLILNSGGSTPAELRLYNFAELTISGGSVGSSLWMRGDSSASLVSGSVAGYIFVMENSRLNMSGGRGLAGWIGVSDNGQAEISGGIFGDLAVSSKALITLIGSDFKIGNQNVNGLLNIPQLVASGLLTAYEYPDYHNVQYEGVLSGRLLDGRLFNSNISIAHRTDGGGNTANINLVPEPATLLLLGLGGILLRRR